MARRAFALLAACLIAFSGAGFSSYAFLAKAAVAETASFLTADGDAASSQQAAGDDSSTEPHEPVADDAPDSSEAPGADVENGTGELDDVASPDDSNTGTLGDRYSPESVATPVPAGTYYIRPYNSLVRMLDIANGSTASGANLQLYASNKSASQQFSLSYDSQGYYTINTAFAKALDAQGGLATNGTNVWQYVPNGTAAQKWVVRGNSGTGYEFVSMLSSANREYCLDVANASDANCANLQLYSANGSAAQRFALVPVDLVLAGQQTVADGFYTFAPEVNRSLSLDVPNASFASSVQIQTYKANSSFAQLFAVTWNGRSYNIKSANSGKALDVANAAIVAGAAVQQYSPNGSKAQEWQISIVTPGADPVVSIQAVGSGLAMDVANGSASAGAKLQLYTPNGSPAQRFAMKQVNVEFGEGAYAFAPSEDTSLRLDITNGSSSAGALVQAYPANYTAAQAYYLEQHGSLYSIAASNTGLLLTEESNKNVAQQPMSGGVPAASQLWEITLCIGGFLVKNSATGDAITLSGRSIMCTQLVGGEPSFAQLLRISETTVVFTGTFALVTPSGFRLGVANSGTASGSRIGLVAASDNRAQKFFVGIAHTGVVGLRNALSFKMVEIANGSAASGASLQLYPSNMSAAQEYSIMPVGDGWYILRSALGTYVTASSDAAGANVLTTDNKSNAQRFKFTATQAWTSGDFTLDAKLSNITDAIGRDGDVLRKCYDYVTAYSYRDGSVYPSGNWVPGFALEMVNYGSGNCYRYAALLGMLMQYNGYNCQVIAGGVQLRNGTGPHSWVEYYPASGGTYVLDAEAPHDLPQYNWYMITYSQAPITYVH